MPEPMVVDHLLAATLMLVDPLWGAREYRRLLVRARAGVANARAAAYRKTMLLQWTFAIALVAFWLAANRPAAALGLTAPGGVRLLVGAIVTALGIAFLYAQWNAVSKLDEQGLTGLRAQAASVADLTPQTEREAALFRGVSITTSAAYPRPGSRNFDLGSAVGATSAVYNGDLVTLASPGRHLTSDPSCGGTLTASSTTAAYNLAMAGATPSQAALIMLAYQASTFAGVPLPIPLDGAGMPGCLLGVDPLLFVGGVADGSGAFSLSIPLTLPAEAMGLYAQGLHVQPSIPAGVATTNVTRSILGLNGFCRYIYNFTIDGPNAQNGPNSWQGAMLLQP